jgi:hypothetical protein
MNRTWRRVSSVMLMMLLGCGIGVATAGEAATKSSGTVTMTATTIAVGVGWSWGRGKLTLLDGSEYAFRVNGLDVAAAGVSQVTAVGTVYNLSQPQDLEGKYVAVSAGAVVGGGAEATSMRNDKGVVINLTGTAQGMSVNLSLSGVSISEVKKEP